MREASLKTLVSAGESATLEFKRSTGELRQAFQTLCAFANGSGGKVVIGVRPDGHIVGQQVSEQTLHDIAAAREGFEPPVEVGVERATLANDQEVLVLSVSGTTDSVPCTFDGRAYERVANTTRKMSQERYEALLLDRAHSRRRWENQVADEITIKDIDREEATRIVEAARSSGRLVGPVGRSLPDLLDRLSVRRKGQLLRAAVVLFGRTFLPDYPQCELRMARFRGRDKTEFLDQRQLRGPAFKLLEEAELFCQRHFPLPGRVEPGRLQRVDRPLLPPDAMREILVNALIHRDYSIAGGAVSLAIFDDRVEVWSAGRYPAGITPESLTGAHPSVQRNPIIAEVFYRAGLIEKWGRGTNRVAEMCRSAGIAAPAFAEIAGAAVATFRVSVAQAGVGVPGADEATPHVTPHVAPHVTPHVERLLPVVQGEMSRDELMASLGLKDRMHFTRDYLGPATREGWIEMTLPEKPRSRSQRYRLTERGREVMRGQAKAK